MPKLDPRLNYLLLRGATAFQSEPLSEALGILPEFLGPNDPQVRVLIQFAGDLQSATLTGLRVTSVAGDVAAGFIAVSDLEDLEALPNVMVIESSRAMNDELNVSCSEIRADQVHTLGTGFTCKGQGVIVGVIDSGIDFSHPCFVSTAADGTRTSRILAIWDQGLTALPTEAAPMPYGFGVEYTQTDINAALAGTGVVRHSDTSPDGHGTHVACIAAGSPSSAAGGNPAGHFTGIAPCADIVVVANRAGRDIGTSANTLDAVDYLFAFAKQLGRPIVINQSQGDNLGAHDGTSLLERGIDSLLGAPGHAMVKSAGNAGVPAIHAQGTLAAGATLSVAFSVPQFDFTDDTFDLWYDGADQVDVHLRTPGGTVSANVKPNDPAAILPLGNGNAVFIQSSTANPFNGDNRIFIQLQPGGKPAIETGDWEIVLSATTLAATGNFDIWIGRDRVMATFLPPHVTADGTISIPGTARKIITAGAYVTNAAAGVGDIADFSSRGPSRDGRALPTLCAPGHEVTSARARGIAPNLYHGLSGTSMAAPHVVGVAALMLEKCRTLTQFQLEAELRKFARADPHTGTPPTAEWGAGKLDALDSFKPLTCI